MNFTESLRYSGMPEGRFKPVSKSAVKVFPDTDIFLAEANQVPLGVLGGKEILPWGAVAPEDGAVAPEDGASASFLTNTIAKHEIAKIQITINTIGFIILFMIKLKNGSIQILFILLRV